MLASAVTTLTGLVTIRAALLGLLRHLYSLGLALASVVCLECGSENDWYRIAFGGSFAEGGSSGNEPTLLAY